MDASRDEIKRALQLFYRPGEVIELRCFLRGSAILNGYYRDWDRLAADAIQINTQLTPQLSIYTCLNPCRPEVYARRPEKFSRAGKDEGTSDADALLRRWLLVDCDPIRPKGVSATDSQKAAAYELTQLAYRFITEQLQLPAPAVGDSGNGFHLLLPLADLPNNNDTKAACKQLLVQIAEHCQHPAAKIDASMFNASRVCKLPGTIARKGEDTPEQPHRLAKLLSVTQPLVFIDQERLFAAAGQPQAAPQASYQTSSNGRWNVEQLLEERQIEYTANEGLSDKGERWTTYSFACPFSDEHDDGFALFQWDSGAVACKCHHDSCEGKGWAELKRIWQLPESGGDDIEAAVRASLGGQQPATAQPAIDLPDHITPPDAPQAAFYGPLGELVQVYAPYTEASPVAMLACLLTYYGNALGRRYYVELDGRQFPKLFTCLIGRTAKGRKATADQNASRMMDAIWPTAELYRHTGLSTGEGLIKTLLDYKDGMFPCPAVFQEGEFASVIRRKERKGNSLDDVLRNAWDDVALGTTTRADPLRAVGSHVSLCVHVTPDEVKRLLTTADLTSGFANRFLWIHSRRPRRKPDARGFSLSMAPQQIELLQARFQGGMDYYQQQAAAGDVLEVSLTPAAAACWEAIYAQLDGDDDADGLLPDLCARLPAYVRRLAMIYCLADGLQAITPEHLQAALAVVEYSRSTLDYVYSLASWADAGRHQELLQQRAAKFLQVTSVGQQLRRVQVLHDVYQRNRTARELNEIRDHMIRSGRLQVTQVDGVEVWQRL